MLDSTFIEEGYRHIISRYTTTNSKLYKGIPGIDEAKEVCKDRSRFRSTVSA